jgi:hypothetical protein
MDWPHEVNDGDYGRLELLARVGAFQEKVKNAGWQPALRGCLP